ncbi:MAG TPA: M15 family metallopeptidase [Actinotalea sp.]
MTMYVHGRPAAQVRRRRATASAILTLAVLAGASGWYLWGPSPASALQAETPPGRVGATTMPAPQPDALPDEQPAAHAAAQADAQADEQVDGLPDGHEVATGLDPELARRFTVAQKAAAADGVELTITSGWRSAAYQQSLVDQAVVQYGSQEEAHRWVLPPETSEHVKGLAIDVGGTRGALWLGEHARGLGLCQTYANEVWHFEMLADGASECPPMHPDASWGW